jgi:hypothetical protein
MVLNGVTINLEEANLAEVEALIKLATVSQLQINKQQDDAAIQLDASRSNIVLGLMAKFYEYVQRIREYMDDEQSKRYTHELKVLDKKLEIARAKKPLGVKL